MNKLTKDNIIEFLDQHGIEHKQPKAWGNGGQIIELGCCAFDASHNDSGKLLIHPGGGIQYKCHHESCSGRKFADFVKLFEPDFYKDQAATKKDKSGKPASPVLNTAMKTVSDFEEKNAEWLIPGYIPRYTMSCLAGDGGGGKSTLTCNIVAWVTARKPCVLIPLLDYQTMQAYDTIPPAGTVFMFCSEDSFTYTVRRRLRKAGADLSRVLTIDITDPRFEALKFDSDFLKSLLADHKPELVIFDPLQSFIPPDINMGSRNAMRNLFDNVTALAKLYKTTILILAHTNKRPGASGRDRIADSADLWDASRSVLMLGKTKDDNIRYLSHEKNSYAPEGETVLFKIVDETIEVTSYCDRKDSDFQFDKQRQARATPSADAAREFIEEALKDGKEMLVAELEELGKVSGLTKSSMDRVKTQMKKEGVLIFRVDGNNENKKWFVSLKKN